jgi:hypothetical protein
LQVTVSPWELALVGGGAAIAFIAVAIYAGWTLRRRTPEPFQRRSLLSMLAPLLLGLWLGGLLVAGGLAGGYRRSPASPPRSLTGASQHSATAGSSSFSLPSWVPWAALGIVLGGALVVVVGAKTHGRPGEPEALPSAMESAVAAALVDLDTVTDPRLAIIAAYRRMEQSLAAAGIPRAAAEAPREYLGRVAGAMEIDPKPLGTLTALFEAAKFSVREFDASGRQRAVTALHDLQAELA